MAAHHRIALFLPSHQVAKVYMGPVCRRDDTSLANDMKLMENAAEKTIDGNRIRARRNQLNLLYNGRSTVVIALRNDNNQEMSETVIIVRPKGIKIAGKYMIVGDELREKTTASATGSRAQIAPLADAYVLIVSPTLFDDTLALEVNGDRYWLEFGYFMEGKRGRQAVVVSTNFDYSFRSRHSHRQLICDPAVYFAEPRAIPPPMTAISPPAAVGENTSPIENVSNVPQAAPATKNNVLTIAAEEPTATEIVKFRQPDAVADATVAIGSRNSETVRPPLSRNFNDRPGLELAYLYPLPRDSDSESENGFRDTWATPAGSTSNLASDEDETRIGMGVRIDGALSEIRK